MPIETIEQDFKQKVCESLRLTSEGVDRYRVFTPFLFEDGDHLAIVLKREQGRWILSDEGHTYMNISHLRFRRKRSPAWDETKNHYECALCLLGQRPQR